MKPTQILRRKVLARCGIAALGGMAMLCSYSGFAMTTNVTVVEFQFIPSQITIAQGDTVNWNWNSTFSHSSTSDTNGLWDSGLHSGTAFSFPHTFSAGGVYPYHCTLHAVSHNMRGLIRVSAVTNISIQGFAFNPGIVTINPNDTVIWTMLDSLTTHTATADATDSYLWDSGFLSNGQSFTNTFPTPGTFPYHCTVHSFMTATLNVVNPVQVSVTSPADGTVFSAPANVNVSASASELFGSITNVQFYAGGNLFGSASTAPYSATVSNLAAGDVSLAAVAFDNSGFTNISSITVHVITPSAILLSGSQMPAAANFQFNYTADPGLTYIVLRSPDLVSWTPLSTNKATVSPVQFLDTNATIADGFYRVQLAPNP